MYACVLSHVRLFAALQTVAVQAHGLLQARILEGGAISSSRGSPWPRDRAHISCVSCIAGGLFTPEPPGKPAVRIEGDWEVGRRTSLSDMGRSNGGRSGWTLHNKWPQALWRWDSDRCYVHKCRGSRNRTEHSKEVWGHIWEDLNVWAGPRLGLELSACFLTRTSVTWAGWLEGWAPWDGWAVCPHVASPPARASHCMGLASGRHVVAAWLVRPCSRRHRVPSTILLDRSHCKPALTWEERTQSQSLDGMKVKEVVTFFLLPTRT